MGCQVGSTCGGARRTSQHRGLRRLCAAAGCGPLALGGRRLRARRQRRAPRPTRGRTRPAASASAACSAPPAGYKSPAPWARLARQRWDLRGRLDWLSAALLAEALRSVNTRTPRTRRGGQVDACVCRHARCTALHTTSGKLLQLCGDASSDARTTHLASRLDAAAWRGRSGRRAFHGGGDRRSSKDELATFPVTTDTPQWCKPCNNTPWRGGRCAAAGTEAPRLYRQAPGTSACLLRDETPPASASAVRARTRDAHIQACFWERRCC